jgi:hypothetical protein
MASLAPSSICWEGGLEFEGEAGRGEEGVETGGDGGGEKDIVGGRRIKYIYRTQDSDGLLTLIK